METTYQSATNRNRLKRKKSIGIVLLPPVSPFGGAREKKKQTVIEKLIAFFERFFGIA